MGVGELEDAVLRLYGQAAAGQVGSWNLSSFSMADLAHYLGEPPPTSPEVPLTPREDLEEPINSAKWLVFSVLNSSQGIYGSNALKLLLDQRPDLARNKRLIVFAHDVPYGLDATDISKVDVYYALYGSSPIFIDVAAHLLFLEQTALGASPVSVPGAGYDLIDATSPDPEQVILLTVQSGEGELSPEEAPPEFSVGDIINVGTGVIVDTNGNQVPDGTVVEFILVQQGDGLAQTTVEATTQRGVAKTSVSLERLGLLTITARSDPARVSETLQLNVQEDVPALATVISPTLVPTASPEPTATPLAPTPTAFIETTDTESDEAEDIISFSHLVMGLIAVSFIGGIGYASLDRETTSPNTQFRCVLLPVIGGLLGYNYVALGFPGSLALLQSLGVLAGFIVAIGFGAMGLIAARLWCS